MQETPTNVVELKQPELPLAAEPAIEKPAKPQRKDNAKVSKARAKTNEGTATKREKAKVKKVRKQERKSKAKGRAKSTKPKRGKGPAYAKWKSRFRDNREPGQCAVKACKTKPAGRSRMCSVHKKEYRRDQLELNNVTWRKRLKTGEAAHHVWYDGEVTEWALKNPAAALRIIKEGKSIVQEADFKKALGTAQAKLKAELKKPKKAA